MFLLILQTIESEDDRSFVIDLYDQHYRRLLKEANAVLHNVHDAEDIVQDFFAYLISHIEKFRSIQCNVLERYLVVCIRRKSIDAFRILGDVLVDLVRLHRSEEASDHLIRRKDSDLQKRMLIGCKDSRNPQAQILRNCREVVSSKMREYMTDNLTSEEAVMAAIALGKRRFALEVYPGVVKSLCCTEEKTERRLFQR